MWVSSCSEELHSRAVSKTTEDMLAITHNAMESLLLALGNLTKTILESDIKPKPDITENHVFLLKMQMPEKYHLPNSQSQRVYSLKGSGHRLISVLGETIF